MGLALPALAGETLCRAPPCGTPVMHKDRPLVRATCRSDRRRPGRPESGLCASTRVSAGWSGRQRKTGSENAVAARPGLRGYLPGCAGRRNGDPGLSFGLRRRLLALRLDRKRVVGGLGGDFGLGGGGSVRGG